jgi:hypothetical protein
MADPKIRRRTRSFDVTLTSNVSSSGVIRLEDAAGGSVMIAAGETDTEFATAVQVWASDSPAGQFSRLHTDGGEAVNLTIARDSVNSTIYAMPDECYGVGAIKLVTQSTHLTAAIVIVKS